MWDLIKRVDVERAQKQYELSCIVDADFSTRKELKAFAEKRHVCTMLLDDDADADTICASPHTGEVLRTIEGYMTSRLVQEREDAAAAAIEAMKELTAALATSNDGEVKP